VAKIGWVGLGKLGLPCALTFAYHGHQVIGYDVSDLPDRILDGVAPPPREAGIEALLARTSLKLADTIDGVVAESDVVFVAVQTPHAPAYGGENRMPAERRDFEYGFLAQAVRDAAGAAERQRRSVTAVVVSTALPGTFSRHLRSLQNPYAHLIYNPFFIAMGSTISDLENPEFVLVGSDDGESEHVDRLREVYSLVHDKPLFVTPIDTAELVKVAYNTFISMKIVFANMLMEVSHKTGADCDLVVDALSLATDRVVSPAYMRGGMGDGGACHPRDLIAMSWLAERLDLSTDLMGYMASARESQTEWLAGLVEHWHDLTGLNVLLLGKSYKPQSDLVYGSPALLLLSMLMDRGIDASSYDPYVDGEHEVSGKALYVIGTRHTDFSTLAYAPGSVVLDPFGFVPDREDVTVIRIGRKS
jgi:UDPglucose 6-dehydrogenase